MPALKRNRLQLLQNRKRLSLVKRGAKILSDKRDSLLKEFRGMVAEVRDARRDLDKKIDVAGKSMLLARSMESVEGLESAAAAASSKVVFPVSIKRVWGVKIPEIDYHTQRRSLFDRGSLPGYRHPVVDKTAGRFEDVIDAVVKSAVVESRFNAIGGAIRTTSRRVNALEQVIEPEIAKEIGVIGDYLEEMSREEIFRIKRYKALKLRKDSNH